MKSILMICLKKLLFIIFLDHLVLEKLKELNKLFVKIVKNMVLKFLL